MANSKIANFLATTGIYHEYSFCEENKNEILSLFNNKIRYPIDIQCPHCKTDTVFYICDFDTYQNYKPEVVIFGTTTGGLGIPNSQEEYNKKQHNKYLELLKNEPVMCLTAFCTRAPSHTIYIFVKLEANKIIKIGQYPNVKLILFPNVNKYQKLLNDYYIELKTALLLYSNNVGVGSYVYLRRIFEKIIFDKFNTHKNDLKISESEFYTSRMEEKIEILKKYLPEFIVQNKSIYSILSKGVHELDENECLKYFDTIEQSLEIILDEILEQKSKQEHQKTLTKSISKITGDIRNN